VVGLVVVFAAPGLARRLGAGLARREGLSTEAQSEAVT